MNNTVKNLKKRLRAPRALVEATKRGERFVPAYKPDTRAIHIRRFSKALVAYACAAALLIGGMTILPPLIGGDTVSPASNPGSTLSSEPTNSDYVYLSPAQAADYIRPDLIWGNELNPQLKNAVIWSAEIVDGLVAVTNPFEIPDVGDENARYAVEFRIERFDEDAEWISSQYMNRQIFSLQNELQKAEFVLFSYAAADNDLTYHSSVYAAGSNQLSALRTDDLLLMLADADGDLRIELRIAWQSCEAES